MAVNTKAAIEHSLIPGTIIGMGTQEIDLIPTMILIPIGVLDPLPLSDAVERIHLDQVSSVTTAAVHSTGTVTALSYMSISSRFFGKARGEIRATFGQLRID